MNNILDVADQTILETAGGDLISLMVNIVYSVFQFFLGLITTNAGLVVAIVVVYALWSYLAKHKRKIM